MSHFIVNVILPKGEVHKEKIEELLAPYDENIVMEPYILHQKRDAKKLHNEELRYYKKILDRKNENYNLEKIKEYHEQLKMMTAEQYFDGHFKKRGKDAAGNVLSTYNPKSKWDWWQIGGCFAGWLVNLPAQKAITLKDNCCSIEHAIQEKKIPFALVLPNGKWVERGKMGWWAIVKDEIPEKAWEEIVLKYYKKYPKHIVVQVDCHI